MKTAFLLGCIMVLYTWAAPIQSDNDFTQAVQTMGKADKLVLMIYTTDDCPECAYMKQKVFHDKGVEPYLNRHFVILEKNIHKSTLPDGFDYYGIPTMFFTDKKGNKKETLVGSRRTPVFLKELRRIKGEK